MVGHRQGLVIQLHGPFDQGFGVRSPIEEAEIGMTVQFGVSHRSFRQTHSILSNICSIVVDNPVGTLLSTYVYLQAARGADPALFTAALAAQPATLPQTRRPVAALHRSSPAVLFAGAVLAGPRRRDELTSEPSETAGAYHYDGRSR